MAPAVILGMVTTPWEPAAPARARVPGPAGEIRAKLSLSAHGEIGAASEDPVVRYTRPVEVVIPAIGVRSPLIRLGLNPDHTLEVPDDYSIAGWYTGSMVPGRTGPSVIVGHVDSTAGPGVFYSLSALRRGDVVRVLGANGSVASFVVQRLEEVPKDAFPTSRVYGPVAYPALRLITCGGPFDDSIGHYEHNIIAYARLVS